MVAWLLSCRMGPVRATSVLQNLTRVCAQGSEFGAETTGTEGQQTEKKHVNAL